MSDFEKTRISTSDNGIPRSAADVEKIRVTAYAQGLAAANAGGKQEHCPYTGGLGAKFWSQGFSDGKNIKGG